MDTTFVRCTASHSSNAASGGGISHSGGALDILRCCFRETHSSGKGTAIFAESTSESLNDSALVQCSDSLVSATGTIYIDSASHAVFEKLNFTECQFSLPGTGGLGFVFYASQTESTWSFSYAVIVGCSGVSGIHSLSNSVQTVTYCTIYDNELTVGNSYGILTGQTVGMKVDYCIFRGSAKEFFVQPSGVKFTLTGCILREISRLDHILQPLSTGSTIRRRTRMPLELFVLRIVGLFHPHHPEQMTRDQLISR
jgi:hypothetical protein